MNEGDNYRRVVLQNRMCGSHDKVVFWLWYPQLAVSVHCAFASDMLLFMSACSLAWCYDTRCHIRPGVCCACVRWHLGCLVQSGSCRLCPCTNRSRDGARNCKRELVVCLVSDYSFYERSAITTTTILRPLYRSTCVSLHLQFRTGGFCWCKALLPTCLCWQQIQPLVNSS